MSVTAQNLTLLTDLYELTMMQGYFKNPVQETVIFDAFYRVNPCGNGFAIAAGLDQVIDYIKNLHFSDEDVTYLDSLGIFEKDFLEYLRGFHFTGDIYAIPEGTVVFPREPLVKVIAPIMEAQLVETAILTMINHQSLIATKAARVVNAARGDGIMEFGLRRAQGPDAGTYGARAAMIGGCIGTSNVLTGQLFDVPVLGTHAHSWIMSFPDEYTAFKTYAKMYPDACTLLVDTYDTIKSGIPNAIRVAREVLEPMGKRLKGIRIDSGDLAYQSIKVRKMLDDAGLTDCKIIVSNSLDEHTISSLNMQKARIDGYGVGERLITGASSDYSEDSISLLGAVYKIAAVEENGGFAPRIKVSGSVEKITNPGLKKVYRVYDQNGKAKADLIAKADETIDMSQEFRFVDPDMPWRNLKFTHCTVRPLQEKIFENGKLVYKLPTLNEIRAYVRKQLDEEIWEEEQRFVNPHKHYMDMTPDYYDMKMSLLNDSRA